MNPENSSHFIRRPAEAPDLYAKPASIAVIGWSTIAASALLIFSNLLTLVSSSALDRLNARFDTSLITQYVPQSMQTVLEFYAYSRWWTWYGILFFLFVLVAGGQFVRLKASGRLMLEIACWIGLFNAAVDTFLSYKIWASTQETLSMALRSMGGGHSAYLDPVGFFLIILGLFIWIIPSVGLIFYLRRPIIRQIVSLA